MVPKISERNSPVGVSDLEVLITATVPGFTLNRLYRKNRAKDYIPGKDMGILVPFASYALEATKLFLYGKLIYDLFLK